LMRRPDGRDNVFRRTTRLYTGCGCGEDKIALHNVG
jgi:hypothetical protein